MKHQPLFASEATAAALLDMKPTEFRELVAAGSLPPANKLNRWDVAELQAIMRGHAHRPKDELDL